MTLFPLDSFTSYDRSASVPPGWRRSDDGTVYQRGSGHTGSYISHGSWEAWVDAPMAPLVLACWKREIYTISCCQDEDGMANIVFRDRDAARFVDLAGRTGGELAVRIHRTSCRADWALGPDDWRYVAWPYWRRSRPPAFLMKVRFPLADVPELVGRFEGAG
jgi:hypothetical protein